MRPCSPNQGHAIHLAQLIAEGNEAGARRSLGWRAPLLECGERKLRFVDFGEFNGHDCDGNGQKRKLQKLIAE